MADTRPQTLALFTDLYELTMMQAYLAEARRLRLRRSFHVAMTSAPGENRVD